MQLADLRSITRSMASRFRKRLVNRNTLGFSTIVRPTATRCSGAYWNFCGAGLLYLKYRAGFMHPLIDFIFCHMLQIQTESHIIVNIHEDMIQFKNHSKHPCLGHKNIIDQPYRRRKFLQTSPLPTRQRNAEQGFSYTPEGPTNTANSLSCIWSLNALMRITSPSFLLTFFKANTSH